MIRRSVITGLVLLVGSLSGCHEPHEHGSDRMDGASSRGVGSNPTSSSRLLIDTVDAKRMGYAVRWATDLKVPQGHRIEHIRVLGDLAVCVESPSGVVTAISVRDGAPLWSRVIGEGNEIFFAPTRSEKWVLINTANRLYCLDPVSGEVHSVGELESTVTNAPAVVADFAIFGGLDHRVFAHSISDGYTKWAYQMTERIVIQPLVSGPNVFVADLNGVYANLSTASGKLQWKSRIFGRVVSQPVVSPVAIFVGCEDNALYAMNRATGRDKWIYRTIHPLTEDLSLIGGTLFLPIPNEGLLALDERSGKEKWRISSVAEPLLRIGDSLILNNHSSLLKVKFDNGAILDEVPVLPLKTALAAKDDQLLLVTHEGRLLWLSRTQ